MKETETETKKTLEDVLAAIGFFFAVNTFIAIGILEMMGYNSFIQIFNF